MTATAALHVCVVIKANPLTWRGCERREGGKWGRGVVKGVYGGGNYLPPMGVQATMSQYLLNYVTVPTPSPNANSVRSCCATPTQ
jgi:hypothetical protein